LNRLYSSILLSLILLDLNAKSVDDLIVDFQRKNFSSVCNEGSIKIDRGNKDEDFMGVVGTACAEIDSVNKLATIQNELKSTRAGRNNGSYFATLILQKKLLYQFMVDDVDLGYLRVPDTNHILSIVFKYIVLKKFKIISDSPKELEIVDGELKIKLYLSRDSQPKMMINLYKNGSLESRHWYR